MVCPDSRRDNSFLLAYSYRLDAHHKQNPSFSLSIIPINNNKKKITKNDCSKMKIQIVCCFSFLFC